MLKSDIANLSDPSPSMWPRSVETRRCPLAALGQGRASLSDKAHAHANQVWLEYGGSIASYNESNLNVRGIISDMGVECGIGDYVDISNDAFANPARPSKLRSMNDHLYPLALVQARSMRSNWLFSHAWRALPGGQNGRTVRRPCASGRTLRRAARDSRGC